MVVMIEAIGLSLGIFMWSIANMLLGFTTSRLGVFGIPPKIPSKPVTNYVGVAIAVVRVVAPQGCFLYTVEHCIVHGDEAVGG